MRPNPVTCTRRFQFCAGHRVMGHENKCAHLHGHNYVVLCTARVKAFTTQDYLDSIGRVIDFSVLKERIGDWIDRNWDHGFIYHTRDTDVSHLLDAFRPFAGKNSVEAKAYSMPTNPTAENMALYLLYTIFPSLFQDSRIEVCEVTVWETENCFATAKLEGM